jgi:hypothetical protein
LRGQRLGQDARVEQALLDQDRSELTPRLLLEVQRR